MTDPAADSDLHDFYKQRTASLLERIEMALDHLTDENVRRVRVGIKRLRSLFRLMQFVRPKQFKSQKHERVFRKLQKRAGRLRDYQTSLAMLSRLPLSPDLLKRYRRYLEKEEHRAQKRLKKALKTFDKKDLKKAGKLIRRLGVTVAPLKVIQRLRLFIDQETAAMEVLQLAEHSAENTHTLRKHLKAVIEVGTLLNQLTPDDELAQVLTRGKDVQLKLGRWHDRVTLLHHLDLFLAADDELPEETANRLIQKQQRLATQQQQRITALSGTLSTLLHGLAPWRGEA